MTLQRQDSLIVDGTGLPLLTDIVADLVADSISTPDINGGTIDGATIGASSPSTGVFTTLKTTGSAAIGGDAAAGNSLRIAKKITGSPIAWSVYNSGEVQSDAITQVKYFASYSRTQATSFTVTDLHHFNAAQGTFGAGSTVTSQYGFYADNSLVGGTNNYGFFGGLAEGTNRYNFFANGTAKNYFRGNSGIGVAPIDTAALKVGVSDTNAETTGYFIFCNGTLLSTNTDAAYGVNSAFTTPAESYTLTDKVHFKATANTPGAGSTITNEYGFYAGALAGATNTYGVFSAVASAANKYNFYASGTAVNSFSGDVVIHGAGKLGYTTGSGGAVTQGTSRTTGVTLNKTNGAITLVSAAGTTSWQTFTVTNSTVAATDTVHICQKSGTDLNMVHITNVADGSFKVTFATTGGTTTEQPVFNFAVIKGVTS